MYMLRNMVDLVDFDFNSKRRLKFLIYVCPKSWLTRLIYGWIQNLDMYLSRDMVDLVDFEFHSQRRPKIFKICVLEKLVY